MLKNKAIIGGVTIAGLLVVVGISSLAGSNTTTNSSTVSKAQIETYEPTVNSSGVKTKQFKIEKLQPSAEQAIVFNTPVTYETVEVAISHLAWLESQGYKEAYLILDSPGGSVIDGAKLMSYMKYSNVKVHTVCDGICASMAAQLFEVGKVRYMTDKSILMFHPASGGLQGTLEQMLNQLVMIKKYVDRMDAEVALRSGIPYDDFKNRLVSEYWIESEDAINENLADKLAYFSFSRADEEALNIQNELKKRNISVPAPLQKTGVMVFDSIRLTQ